MWPGPVCAWQRQSSSRQHAWSACEHLIGSQLVVMVLRTQWPLGTIAQFFHFVAEEKKKDKKTKAFFDWATKGITVKSPKHKRVSIPIKQHINKTRALTSKFKLSFSTDSVFFPVPLFFCHPWTLLFATKTLLPKRKSVCFPFYRYSND